MCRVHFRQVVFSNTSKFDCVTVFKMSTIVATADCELVALLEDDTGMELLVNNKIISLELPVKDVYKKIWVPDHGDGEAMRIVYRMRGLLGKLHCRLCEDRL